MLLKNLVSTSLSYLRVSVVALMILQLSLGGLLAVPLQARDTDEHFTRTPIKHVIVLIGENRTFDHLFATYVPKSDDSVSNLLSKGIINSDGTPGPHFKKAAQFQATRPFKTEYYISLNKNEKTPYDILPEPTLNFSPSPATGEPPPFPAATPLALLGGIEPSLETADLHLLTTGASGAAQTAELPDFDSRIQNFNNLPNGPFPLEGASLPYDSYTGDTTHRLFEMWQYQECHAAEPLGLLERFVSLRDHLLYERARSQQLPRCQQGRRQRRRQFHGVL
jgi:phospholipase C